MKKFLPKIFIAILLVGFFVPVLVGAQLVTCDSNGQPAGCIPSGTAASPASAAPQQTSISANDCLGTLMGEGQDLASATAECQKEYPTQAAQIQTATNAASSYDSGCGFTDPVACIADIAYLILGIMALILWLAGTALNFVMNYTVVNMATHVAGFTGINIAWAVIRDLMNIAFIFLLVYEAIKLIIGQSNTTEIKKFITGIVLASLLINFSLFFTKLLIDASNIVTIGFYNSIIAVGTPTATITTTSGGAVGNTTSTVLAYSGLSVPFMNTLGLTSFYSGDSFSSFAASAGNSNTNITIIGLAGSILFLVTAFAFLAVTVMFVIRYVILLVLMMLSPVAYMGMALPFMKEYADKWWKALKSQLLFAPLYMLMTWVVLTLMASPGFISAGGANWGSLFIGKAGAGDSGSISLLFNFVVVIGLVIASLIMAKSTSDKGNDLIKTATDKLTKSTGTVLMGGSAWLGRKTVGLPAKYIADNAKLQEKAEKGGTLARLGLYTARTARDATFDLRNASIPTSVVGDAIRGTVGRTGAGKALGLNDVNIASIPIGDIAPEVIGPFGKGGTKGYKELKDESNKRVRDREAADAAELALAQAKENVKKGAKNGAPQTDIDAMEKALAKLSDKQTEALVASNRELLKSQNFANSISVKQLEAINKSDQFSEEDKQKIKDNRFKEIETIYDPVAQAAYTAASAVPVAMRTATQNEAIARMDSARGKVKGLSDSELEMVNSNYLDPTRPEGKEFIAQLRAPQAETITTNKSGKFTSTQKNAVKNERMRPLIEALTPGPTYNPTVAQAKVRQADIKTLVSYMKTSAGPGQPNIALHPDIIPTYTVKTLQRMAAHENMTDDDIHNLRLAIMGGGLFGAPGANAATVTWLTTGAGLTEFP